MIRVIGPSSAADLVTPPGTNAGASRDLDNVVVLEDDIGVAGEVRVVNILDGEVAGGGTDADELALVNAVDRDALEDGVGAGRGGQGDEAEGLHGDGSCLRIGSRSDFLRAAEHRGGENGANMT